MSALARVCQVLVCVSKQLHVKIIRPHDTAHTLVRSLLTTSSAFVTAQAPAGISYLQHCRPYMKTGLHTAVQV